VTGLLVEPYSNYTSVSLLKDDFTTGYMHGAREEAYCYHYQFLWELVLVIFLICGIYAIKKEGQQFHQYQQNKQSPLT
jgi:hypothetical protein